MLDRQLHEKLFPFTQLQFFVVNEFNLVEIQLLFSLDLVEIPWNLPDLSGLSYMSEVCGALLASPPPPLSRRCTPRNRRGSKPPRDRSSSNRLFLRP